ncbi:MAG: aromatic ring-hydroxylating dioxygenase subunit alpha [Pseudomonadales bacterium]
MKKEQIATLRGLMEYEAARTAPPEAFPTLPDIPAGRYTDPRFYALEKEFLWRKAWLFAAHIDEVPEPGCFVTWENTGDPVVIVHGRDGEIRAFYNTCSHRGAPVVTDTQGRRPTLTCKYHGWSYGLNGDLISIRDAEDFRELDFSCRGLKAVRCERFGNLIYLNFDDEAMPLLEWLGPVIDELQEFQFEHCRLVSKRSFDLNCNWKIAMEANTEVYHVPNIHPQTVAPALDHRRNVNSFYANGHGRMVAPGHEKGGVERGSPIDRSPFPTIDTVSEIGQTCTQSYGIFPNWVSPLSPQTIPPLLFWPTSIRTSRLEVWTMYHGQGSGGEQALKNIWTDADDKELGAVLQEDTQFGEAIQRSMESRGFSGVPLSYQEARIYHWNQWADRIIGPDNIPPELRVAQVIGDEWLMPNDPRIAEMNSVRAQQA